MIRHSMLLLWVFLTGIAHAATIQRQIDAMSDEQKVAQLLFVAIPAQVENATVRELVGKWRVGGVVLFAYNLEHPEQVRRFNEAIARHAGEGVAPFIAIDQEGGIVLRLRSGVPVIPSAMAIGATRSLELARRAGAGVGSALRGLGFTMNFAPVLDVLTNQDNAAIGTRAFSDDPALVATLGTAFVEGQQAAGVIAVGKHFPGLGAVADDPHKRLPRLDASKQLLQRRELVPFAAALRAGIGAIMTAHVSLPRVTGDETLPATLSPRIMKGLLRDEMRFDGIVISDALQMDALARERGAGALALDAILAGSDMVLALGSAGERRKVFDGLVDAYRDGRLPKARVDEALRRILTAKERLRPTPSTEADPTLVSDIAARAITLVPGSASLPEWSPDRVLYVGPAGPLQTLLAPARSVILPDRMRPAAADLQFMKARAVAGKSRLCVAAARNSNELAVVSRLRSEFPELPIVFVNLGSPWRVLIGPHSSTLLTYAEDDPSQIAAARVLLGQARATGTAPVSLPRRNEAPHPR